MSRVDLEASPTKDACSLPSVAGSHINIVPSNNDFRKQWHTLQPGSDTKLK